MWTTSWFFISTIAFKIPWSLKYKKKNLLYPPWTAHIASWFTSIFQINAIPSSSHCCLIVFNCCPFAIAIALLSLWPGSEHFWGANQAFTDFHCTGIRMAPCQRWWTSLSILWCFFYTCFDTHRSCPHGWYKYIQAKVIYV